MDTVVKNNIKLLRTSRNMLQQKLADELNVTQETVSSYETGRVTPSADILIKLTKIFNTNIDYLLCNAKYNLPIDSIKPNDISDADFIILNKIKQLSNTQKNQVDGYIDGLTNK